MVKDEINNNAIPSAIYARVSPTIHVKTSEGIHASIQETLRMCTEAAEKDGNPIVKTYIDQYISGKSTKDMPDFQNMLKDGLSDNPTWKRLYVRRVDRFGRNWHGSAIASGQLIENGISICFVENSIDTLNPLGKGAMGLFFDIAEMGRKEILTNTARGRTEAILKGVKFGQPMKELNVNLIRQSRIANLPDRITWKQLEKDLDASRTIMIRRLKDAGFWDNDKGCVK